MEQNRLQELTDKYYKGETNLEEEQQLREMLTHSDEFPEDRDMFAYFGQEKEVPEGLEDFIFSAIQEKEQTLKVRRIPWVRWTSAAAVVVLCVSVFILKPGMKRATKLSDEQKFALMEVALAQVSNSLQPELDNDEVVIFQDDSYSIVVR